jgi:heterodisulfide reductase subunit B
MRYAFYPGCTLHGTSKEYYESTRQVFRALGVELEEIRDWNCCGATALAAASDLGSLVVPLRNLAIAEETGLELAAACNCCFMTLRRSLEAFRGDPARRAQMESALAAIGRHFAGKVEVRHILDILVSDVGLPEVERLAGDALKNYKSVPYYGCQISRPKNPYFGTELPEQLDDLLRACGLDVPRFDRKTKCCGAALMTSHEGAALDMVAEILDEAHRRGADFITVTCPMCQLNVEAYQGKVNARHGTRHRIPVLYFTQVLGLAFDIAPLRLGLGRHMVSPKGLLVRRQKEAVQ